MRFVRLLLLAAAGWLSGCATLGYYAQAVGGQLDILGRSQPIQEILEGSADAGHATPLSPATRARLAMVLRVRTFAVEALGLPDNDSYRRYAELERSAVAWNVIATPEFSLTPDTWCYPIAGCVPYRGYFAQKNAERLAGELKRDGLDVRIAAVAGYSTLGWFADPLLSTQLARDDTGLAGLIFHELAHQVLYLPGDAVFNESFATAVEIEGLRRWLGANGNSAEFERWRAERERQAEFVQLILDCRRRLEKLYAASRSVTDMRQEKARVFAELRAAYAERRRRWGEDAGYDRWFAQNLNNAHLASVELYHQHVPAFQALLAQHHNDWRAFYRAARALSRLPAAERESRLAGLAAASIGSR